MSGERPLQIHRGLDASVLAYTGPQGEPVYNIETHRLHLQDGLTTGGFPISLLSESTLFAATRAALLTVPTGSLATGAVLYLGGYYTSGDLGGGAFRWDAASVATIVPGYIEQPTAVTVGRWVRLLLGGQLPCPEMFGGLADAVISGSGHVTGTVNDTAIANCLSYFGECHLSRGTYGVEYSASWYATGWVRFTGEGSQHSTLVYLDHTVTQAEYAARYLVGGNGWPLDLLLNSDAAGCEISGLTLDLNGGNRTTGAGLSDVARVPQMAWRRYGAGPRTRDVVVKRAAYAQGSRAGVPETFTCLDLAYYTPGHPGRLMARGGSGAVSGSGTGFVDTGATFTSACVGLMLRILNGTGAGQTRRIASVTDSHTLVVTGAWGTYDASTLPAPDNTSGWDIVDNSRLLRVAGVDIEGLEFVGPPAGVNIADTGTAELSLYTYGGDPWNGVLKTANRIRGLKVTNFHRSSGSVCPRTIHVITPCHAAGTDVSDSYFKRCGTIVYCDNGLVSDFRLHDSILDDVQNYLGFGTQLYDQSLVATWWQRIRMDGCRVYTRQDCGTLAVPGIHAELSITGAPKPFEDIGQLKVLEGFTVTGNEIISDEFYPPFTASAYDGGVISDLEVYANPTCYRMYNGSAIDSFFGLVGINQAFSQFARVDNNLSLNGQPLVLRQFITGSTAYPTSITGPWALSGEAQVDGSALKDANGFTFWLGRSGTGIYNAQMSVTWTSTSGKLFLPAVQVSAYSPLSTWDDHVFDPPSTLGQIRVVNVSGGNLGIYSRDGASTMIEDTVLSATTTQVTANVALGASKPGWYVHFISGVLSGQLVPVTSNTGSVITLASTLTQAPGVGDHFRVYPVKLYATVTSPGVATIIPVGGNTLYQVV